jgi:hypothetical protein
MRQDMARTRICGIISSYRDGIPKILKENRQAARLGF